MVFVPKIADAVRILERCGYTRIRPGEFSRPVYNPNRKTNPTAETLIRRRFHAFVRGNDIDLHYDMPVGKEKRHRAQEWIKPRPGAHNKGLKYMQKELTSLAKADS